MTGQAVTVGQARELLAQEATLVVDVRSTGEYFTSHIPESINIPVDQLDPHLRRIVSSAGGTLVLVCQSGGRAEMAADKLGAGGLSDLVVLSGGMSSWVEAGAPVEHGEVTKWALERQVRLVAGSIVLFSVLLSLVWPLAVLIAGAIGLGLAVAALTNTCLMGMMLLKLPYNRGPGCDIDEAIAKLSRQPDLA